MKLKNYEQRSYASDVTANSNEIVGNPVVCGVRTQMLDYIEIIEPGALTEADISDVLLTVNHNLSDIPLARSRGGQPGETMQLSVDNYNCCITAQLDVENNPQEGDLVGAIYEGIAEFLNGLDDAERAEVLYDVYAANVYQNGNGEDEQGRVLHTMFDQVIIENVSFK